MIYQYLLLYLIIFMTYLSHAIIQERIGSASGWDLPVIPDNFDELLSSTPLQSTITNNKLVPKNIWISFRELPPKENFTQYYQHLQDIFDKASSWTVHMLDDHDIDMFMDSYYRNSSVYHAYHLIHPKLRVASSDIWRYCALYAFGGFYIDDDASIRTPLDEVVQADDSMILTFEGNPHTNCYNETYHLSESQLYDTYHDQYSTKYISIAAMKFRYYNRNIVQWAMFTEARHPIFLKVLSNIVEILKAEYFQRSLILPSLRGHHIVMCTTGPKVFTATIREELLKQARQNVSDKSGYSIRFVPQDFAIYDAKYKVKGFVPYVSKPSGSGEEVRWRNNMPSSILRCEEHCISSE